MGWRLPHEQIILASTSITRQNMLKTAGLEFTCVAANIDEKMMKQAAQAENIPPHEIAIMLAQMKAQSVNQNHDGFILGCDQLLECENEIFGKPEHEKEAQQRLMKLAGKIHILHTAIVISYQKQRIWHYASMPHMHMRQLSETDILDYLKKFKTQALSTAGGYQIEAGGAHLFDIIDGNYFDILGLPLLPLLAFLRQHGLKYCEGEV